MRYIDTSSLVIQANWVALSKASNCNPVWSYLRDRFEALVGKKCWYNESINDGTSNPVDHFRPKATSVKALTSKYAVLEAPVWAQLRTGVQTGYPFLEFEHTNYRYACGFANSLHKKESVDGITRGKSNFFPLEAGSNPALSISGLGAERPALLDPCEPNDPELLTFNEVGGIDPEDSILLNSWEYCRVKVSIEVYNLMYHVILSKRQELWLKSVRDIEIISRLYNKANKSDEENLSFDYFYLDFIKSLGKNSEYSAVVIDCLKYYRKRKDPVHYRWLHDTLLNPLLKK